MGGVAPDSPCGAFPLLGALREGNGRRASPAELLSFFLRKAWTTVVPRAGAARRVQFDRKAMRRKPSLTWIGHSTMLVRMDAATFLTDPVFSARASPLGFVGPKRLVPPGVPLGELPAVDFALLSHDHYDHTDLISVGELARRGVRFAVPAGMGALVTAAGGEAIELGWWERAEIAGLTVHCVPAQHFSGRGLADGNRRLWAGWVVEGCTRRFYYAGDTGYFSGFAAMREQFDPIDLAALPIGAYEPSAIMRQVHLNPEEAVAAAIELGARRVVGVHFGTFDLTDEALDEPPRRFHAAAARQGLEAGQAWTLCVGETRCW